MITEAPLRLHHLATIRSAILLSPAYEAELITKSLILDRLSIGNPETGWQQKNYYQDVVGPTPDTMSHCMTQLELAYLSRLTKILESYLALPRETTVKLIPTGKDWICFGCTTGAHCTAPHYNQTYGDLNPKEFRLAHKLKGYFPQEYEINDQERYATISYGALEKTLPAIPVTVLS